MDDQILHLISSDLAVIKWLLIGLFVLLLAVVIVIGFFLYTVSKDLTRDLSLKASFQDKGRELLDKGELEELLQLAGNKLEKYPDHEYANYFIANCYYRMGKIHEAYRAFKRLKELRPGWAKEYIDPYLCELEVKIKNSKPELLK